MHSWCFELILFLQTHFNFPHGLLDLTDDCSKVRITSEASSLFNWDHRATVAWLSRTHPALLYNSAPHNFFSLLLDFCCIMRGVSLHLICQRLLSADSPVTGKYPHSSDVKTKTDSQFQCLSDWKQSCRWKALVHIHTDTDCCCCQEVFDYHWLFSFFVATVSHLGSFNFHLYAVYPTRDTETHYEKCFTCLQMTRSKTIAEKIKWIC